MNQDTVEKLLEDIRTGETETLVRACAELVRRWRTAPVEELLSLKEQFMKMDLEHREAHVEELLVSIAEKRPAPFKAIVSDPGHPLWRPAIEVLSLIEGEAYLDLFISLVPLCPDKGLKELARAIGRHRGARSARALGGLLSSSGEPVFMEAVLALKRCGGPEAVATLREALAGKRREGSEMAAVVEAVLREMGARAVPEEDMSETTG